MPYIFYNRNDKGELKEDCVCRAISTATRLKYPAVENLLEISAKFHRCKKLCVCCYRYLLENILCYSIHYCNNGETVEEIARKLKNERVIIRIDGHLTSSIYGNVCDIWDCARETVDCFWIVDE